MAWTKRGQRAFNADDLHTVVLEGLTDAEALAMLLDPSLFTDRIESIKAASASRFSETLQAYDFTKVGK